MVSLIDASVAPDYVLVESKVAYKFVEAMKKMFVKMMGDNPQDYEYYGRIINDNNFKRLTTLLDAEKKIPGVKFAHGGNGDANTRFIEPTLITGINKNEIDKHPIMQEEIFGPILPIIEVFNADEAIQLIKKIDKSPLAYYPFSDHKEIQDKMIGAINAGGCMVNDVYIHGLVH